MTIPFRFAKGVSGVVPPALDLDFTAGSLPSGVTFTRASNGWYFNSSGVLTQASSNAPRFDYNPSTLALRGLLIEQQSTNLLPNSNAFTSGGCHR